MVGWMLVFLMMTSVTAVVAGTAHGVGFTAAATSGIVFGFLLVVSALTRVLRGQV